MCGLMQAPDAAALELRGVKLPERIAVDSTELVLNGAGVRTEASLDRYVLGLYLTRPQARLAPLLADRGRKRISITILRTTLPARFTEAFAEALGANLTPSELESLQAPLDELNAILGAIGTLRAGAVLDIDYVPGAGTQVRVQGKARAGIIRGIGLYQALLRAWLDDDPIDRDLRRALLGRRIDVGAH